MGKVRATILLRGSHHRCNGTGTATSGHLVPRCIHVYMSTGRREEYLAGTRMYGASRDCPFCKASASPWAGIYLFASLSSGAMAFLCPVLFSRSQPRQHAQFQASSSLVEVMIYSCENLLRNVAPPVMRPEYYTDGPRGS